MPNDSMSPPGTSGCSGTCVSEQYMRTFIMDLRSGLGGGILFHFMRPQPSKSFPAILVVGICGVRLHHFRHDRHGCDWNLSCTWESGCINTARTSSLGFISYTDWARISELLERYPASDNCRSGHGRTRIEVFQSACVFV